MVGGEWTSLPLGSIKGDAQILAKKVEEMKSEEMSIVGCG
jgi:hypothetical protein